MKFPSFRWFSCSLCALAAVWAGVPATAQTPGYSARIVKIINNFPAGGPSDNLARTVAVALQGTLKQTFIVENKPGAGDNVGVDCPPDTPAFRRRPACSLRDTFGLAFT